MLLLRKSSKHTSARGGSLVEIVIVAGIITGALIAILGLASLFVATAHLVQQTGQATLLAQEGLEIVRNYRDGTDWAIGLGAVSFAPASYHPEQSGAPPSWVLMSGDETLGEFTRSLQFQEVYRDGDDNIAGSGTVDDNTVKVTVTVSWQERGRTHEVQLSAYIANWK